MTPIYLNETGAASASKSSGKAQLATAIGQVVGDVVVGLIQNKTQKDYNNAKIAAMKEDSRLDYLTAEERLALDKKIANAVNDVAKLRIYQEELAKVSSSSLQSSASIYAEKIKNQSANETRGMYIIAGLSALLIAGAVFIYIKKTQ